MRRRFRWMNKASTPVLELLAESGLALNPKGIQLNLQRKIDDPPARRTIYRCLEPLEERGFIKNISDSGSYYVITERGQSYLNEELSESEIEDLSGE